MIISDFHGQFINMLTVLIVWLITENDDQKLPKDEQKLSKDDKKCPKMPKDEKKKSKKKPKSAKSDSQSTPESEFIGDS